MSRSTGVVIVSYNSADCLVPCLKAVLTHYGHVVVVDNASNDGSVAVARSVPTSPGQVLDVWEAGKNLGFAGGVNAGVRRLGTDNVLVLNPDVCLAPGDGLRESLESALNQENTGAVAGVLRAEGTGPQAGFTVRRLPRPRDLILEALGVNAVWPSNRANVRYRCLDLDLHAAQEVEQPAGAFLMFRREAWLALGGWDEEFYPVWFEDVDFCRRLSNAGWKIRLAPGARALHAGGHSVGKLTPLARASYWYGSLLKYSAKHFGPWRTRFVAAAVVIGIAGRMILHFLHLQRGSLSALNSVLGFAARCVVTGRAPQVPAGSSIRANQALTTRHLHGL
ncbi:MAG: glycosyltransferase family 2 protein [Acidobacteriota bacterium]